MVGYAVQLARVRAASCRHVLALSRLRTCPTRFLSTRSVFDGLPAPSSDLVAAEPRLPINTVLGPILS